ncbi:unnamed protein product [Amoebophrya sp. A120]|nr:unnamed protein product [Amoebophrya sp. A120]|eukprot:GSA120T00008334001.1
MWGPLAFSYLCTYYGLVTGEFRDALKRAWKTPVGTLAFPPTEIRRDIAERASEALLMLRVDDAGRVACHGVEANKDSSDRVWKDLRRARFWEAATASHLEDIEALLSSGVDGRGPVRFFNRKGRLAEITASRVQNERNEPAGNYLCRRDGGGGRREVPRTLVPMSQADLRLGFEGLKSALAETVEDINKTVDNRLRRLNVAQSSSVAGPVPGMTGGQRRPATSGRCRLSSCKIS